MHCLFLQFLHHTQLLSEKYVVIQDLLRIHKLHFIKWFIETICVDTI